MEDNKGDKIEEKTTSEETKKEEKTPVESNSEKSVANTGHKSFDSDDSGKQENLTNKMRDNPWIIATLVLGVLALILIVGNFNGPTGSAITGNVIAGENVGNSILELAQSQVEDAELVSVTEKYGLYEVLISMSGQEVPVYVTLDGENLFSGPTPISVLKQQQEAAESNPQPTEVTNTQLTYSEEDLEKISVVINCLDEKGVKIYGANWCGYTNAFVEDLGGYEIIAPIYVECTEEVELCSQEEVKGYPTTKINGESYSGPRTFEGLSQATGCPVPEIDVQTGSVAEASC